MQQALLAKNVRPSRLQGQPSSEPLVLRFSGNSRPFPYLSCGVPDAQGCLAAYGRRGDPVTHRRAREAHHGPVNPTQSSWEDFVHLLKPKFMRHTVDWQLVVGAEHWRMHGTEAAGWTEPQEPQTNKRMKSCSRLTRKHGEAAWRAGEPGVAKEEEWRRC